MSIVLITLDLEIKWEAHLKPLHGRPLKRVKGKLHWVFWQLVMHIDMPLIGLMGIDG